MAQLLHVSNLNIIYTSNNEKVHAVNGVSFDVEEGETLGLVGETGAGKTTTALGLMSLLPERTAKIISGEIIFNGKKIRELSERELRQIRGRDISMIYQDPMTSLNPVLTVGSQIYECFELHNVDKLSPSRMKEKVDEMLEMVGIPSKRGSEYPHQFSGGMKQRVVIAMALACNPKLLIADEPTTALDVTIQAQVLEMMCKLKKEFGMAILIITHDLGVVAEICDRVAIMYAGEIVEIGKAEELFSDCPHHPYTIGLFEAIPDLNSTNRRLRPIDGLMPDPTSLPHGCKFHVRCPNCMEICRKTEPPTIEYDNGHRVCCWLCSTEVAKD